MAEWPLVKLGDVALLLSGFPFESAKFTEDPTAPRLLRGDNVGQGTLRWEGVKRWPMSHADELAPYWLKPGDVVIAMDRPWIEAGLKFAAVGKADTPSLLVQRVSRLRGTARLDTSFLRYVVAFDPVRAKAEGREPGSPASITELFPDSLAASDIGHVPKGWPVEALSGLVDVERGLSYGGAGLAAEGLPMHNLNSILEGGGYKGQGLKHYTGAYRARHVARAGDILVANTEQGHERRLIGYAAIVPARFGEVGIFSHHIFRVRARGHLTHEYLCHLLNTRVVHDLVSGFANGTTVNTLPMEALQVPLVVVPPVPLVAAFSAFSVECRRREDQLEGEAATLATLRDTLLPKLLSGEIQVGEAEFAIGATSP